MLKLRFKNSFRGVLEKFICVLITRIIFLFPKRRLHHEQSVTVLVITKDNESTLAECLYSLLNQSYSNVNIHVAIDPTSIDKTEEIARLFVQNYTSRVSVEILEESGLYGNKHKVINTLKTDYITFLDADDIATPNRIEKQVRKYKKNGPNYVSQIRIYLVSPFKIRVNAAKNSILLSKFDYCKFGGYANVVFGGDTEFVSRTHFFFGQNSIVSADTVGNISFQRANSLTQNNQTGTVTKQGRKLREKFVKNCDLLYKEYYHHGVNENMLLKIQEEYEEIFK